ncbi:TetR/AcrR family transcriptional regulator [Pseudogemmobacter humi]|uniref:DNA-binding transcriptional repressor AcrR n=1 Tax=Pseudogemmobacter humi TaxID=2483812 RepID=A0A3P5X8I3_9RHOB|nr:TetR/AcrR family transcriptional regulator [Pseudogemmobacter humi]VDC27539.1 DNA-binding transcriptional repressor AcrR [Pseudogemmobacter humi]
MPEQDAATVSEGTGSEQERSERLTRQDWLDLALRTLVEDGIDRVKIQIMARQLDVARSSFYWHFESREDLHKAMLEDWLKKNTSPIIERAMRPAPDIIRAVINVFECWIDEALFNPGLDIAVRLWARRAPEVRRVVLEADQLRVDALRRMFLRHGYAEREALIRARVLYYTQIGHHTLEEIEAPEVRFSHGPAYLHIFTGLVPDEELCRDFFAKLDEIYFRPRRARG